MVSVRIRYLKEQLGVCGFECLLFIVAVYLIRYVDHALYAEVVKKDHVFIK